MAQRIVITRGMRADLPNLVPPPSPFPALKNALEDVLKATFEQMRRREAGFCACTQCRDDVITHALNKARPRYINSSLIGAAVTRVELEQGQARAEMAVLIYEAMRCVAANPRHAPIEGPAVGGVG